MESEDKKSSIKDYFENHSAEDLLIWFFIILIVIIFIILLIPSKGKNNPIKEENKKVTINLVGENPYYILTGKSYEEPGYEAYDENGNNISYKIVKTGVVNTNEPGRYEITYKIDDIEIKRLVIVSNLEAKFVEEDEGYTNEEVTIMLVIKGADYLKTILPDKTESNAKAIEYEVSENGEYEFIVYDRHNNQIVVSKKVENIDKEKPTGSCTNKLDLGKTYVEVEAKDDLSGIESYIYSNGSSSKTSNEAKYEYSGLYKDINVTIIDKVGNKETIKCVSSGEGALPPIAFPTDAKYKADSDTLKVAIEKKGNYYLTRVWVLDPYNQINKGIIEENWNKKRSRASEIINNEIKLNNLQNKIVVGINGSGFYENGTWTPNCSSSSYKNQYNRTTEGPLVIRNNKVIRSWYSDDAIDRSRNHSIYTISKEGNFEVYQNFNKLSENERKNLFDSIIKKDYRNTWTFRPVAILNGNILTTDLVGSQLKNRNVVCQINRNNWVILTGSTTAKDAVNILKNLGCQTAVNMDGSGSVSLHFKDKNGSLETIYGGARDIVDTLYITEK